MDSDAGNVNELANALLFVAEKGSVCGQLVAAHSSRRQQTLDSSDRANILATVNTVFENEEMTKLSRYGSGGEMESRSIANDGNFAVFGARSDGSIFF